MDEKELQSIFEKHRVCLEKKERICNCGNPSIPENALTQSIITRICKISDRHSKLNIFNIIIDYVSGIDLSKLYECECIFTFIRILNDCLVSEIPQETPNVQRLLNFIMEYYKKFGITTTRIQLQCAIFFQKFIEDTKNSHYLIDSKFNHDICYLITGALTNVYIPDCHKKILFALTFCRNNIISSIEVDKDTIKRIIDVIVEKKGNLVPMVLQAILVKIQEHPNREELILYYQENLSRQIIEFKITSGAIFIFSEEKLGKALEPI